ncbi:MAG: hypothetical protein U5K38_02945 [Woeseiaceae bacterium]|nr:hypothetical protein [Woeseiaceae bacterium]
MSRTKTTNHQGATMKNASFLLFTTILAIFTNLRADGEQSTEERQIAAVFEYFDTRMAVKRRPTMG